MNIRPTMLLVAAIVAGAAHAKAAPLDENIATSYTALGTSIKWQTAGVNPPISSETLGPFSSACAILEGPPTTKGDVMTRSVYVLDQGNGETNTVVGKSTAGIRDLDNFDFLDEVQNSKIGRLSLMADCAPQIAGGRAALDAYLGNALGIGG